MGIKRRSLVISAGAVLLTILIGYPAFQGGGDQGYPLAPLADGGGSSESFDPYDPRMPEFEQCVIDILDPARTCFDIDSTYCHPDLQVSDEAILQVCGQIFDDGSFLAAPGDQADDEEAEQKLRDKITEIRELIGKVPSIKQAAQELAALVLPGRYNDNEQDALRHILGTAMLLNSIPDLFGARATALRAVNSRETPGTPPGDMDIHNNSLAPAILAGLPKDGDVICELVIAALRKIKDGTAVVITPEQVTKDKVDYWLEHLDELRELLGCPVDEECEAGPNSETPCDSPGTSSSSTTTSSSTSSPTSSTSTSSSSSSSSSSTSSSSSSGSNSSSTSGPPSSSSSSTVYSSGPSTSSSSIGGSGSSSSG